MTEPARAAEKFRPSFQKMTSVFLKNDGRPFRKRRAEFSKKTGRIFQKDGRDFPGPPCGRLKMTNDEEKTAPRLAGKRKNAYFADGRRQRRRDPWRGLKNNNV